MYEGLDTSQRQIRLLRPIWRSSSGPARLTTPNPDPTKTINAVPDLTMEFELEIVSLDDNPVFTALSYHWGSPETGSAEELFITINGHKVGIHENLNSALSNLQYEDIAPAIWTDRLCIHQMDEVEKAEQLLKMREIYSSAAHVVVWLGDATKHSDFLAGAVRGFGNAYRRLFDVPVGSELPLIDYFDDDHFSKREDFIRLMTVSLEDPVVENPTDAPYTAESFAHWLMVFVTCRSWWYRVWIIQEFVLARKVFFQTGTKKFSIDELATIMVVIFYKTMAERISANALQVAWSEDQDLEWPMRLIVAREQGQYRRQQSVYRVLCQSYCHAYKFNTKPRLQSTYPKDYIFGVIGLCEADFWALGLKVELGKSCETIYTDVAEKLIQSGRLEKRIWRAMDAYHPGCPIGRDQ